MRIKNNKINLLISVEHDFAECEVFMYDTVWYKQHCRLTPDIVEALGEYNNGDITLLEFVEYLYDSIRFDDEAGRYKPHKFTTEEWRYILGM